ncbi:hypothetical protein [Stutzerimonas stutzeri]|uniref:hypothetical protein n=1 Tax=Stutzerimonas stutzeri TaxID=316 RepID=UPI0002E307E0|nr:hypothetical protein [Stutzerimonas stutzeri]
MSIFLCTGSADAQSVVGKKRLNKFEAGHGVFLIGDAARLCVADALALWVLRIVPIVFFALSYPRLLCAFLWISR